MGLRGQLSAVSSLPNPNQVVSYSLLAGYLGKFSRIFTEYLYPFDCSCGQIDLMPLRYGGGLQRQAVLAAAEALQLSFISEVLYFQ